MLDINSQEVIAAQVAGSYATDINRSLTRENVQIVSNPIFQYSEGMYDYWMVPAHITTGDNVRAGDIVVVLDVDNDQSVGCFLR